MNFIIEVIKKSADSSALVFVVRRQDGFPMCVKESLDECTEFIQNQIDLALEPKSSDV